MGQISPHSVVPEGEDAVFAVGQVVVGHVVGTVAGGEAFEVAVRQQEVLLAHPEEEVGIGSTATLSDQRRPWTAGRAWALAQHYPAAPMLHHMDKKHRVGRRRLIIPMCGRSWRRLLKHGDAEQSSQRMAIPCKVELVQVCTRHSRTADTRPEKVNHHLRSGKSSTCLTNRYYNFDCHVPIKSFGHSTCLPAHISRSLAQHRPLT